jgi:hypothetical protein
MVAEIAVQGVALDGGLGHHELHLHLNEQRPPHQPPQRPDLLHVRGAGVGSHRRCPPQLLQRLQSAPRPADLAAARSTANVLGAWAVRAGGPARPQALRRQRQALTRMASRVCGVSSIENSNGGFSACHCAPARARGEGGSGAGVIGGKGGAGGAWPGSAATGVMHQYTPLPKVAPLLLHKKRWCRRRLTPAQRAQHAAHPAFPSTHRRRGISWPRWWRCTRCRCGPWWWSGW